MFFVVFLDYFLDLFHSRFVRSKIFKPLGFKDKLLLRTHKKNVEPVGNHNLQFIIRAHEMKQEGLRVSPCLSLLFLMQDLDFFSAIKSDLFKLLHLEVLIAQIVAVLSSRKVVSKKPSNPIKSCSASIVPTASVQIYP